MTGILTERPLLAVFLVLLAIVLVFGLFSSGQDSNEEIKLSPDGQAAWEELWEGLMEALPQIGDLAGRFGAVERILEEDGYATDGTYNEGIETLAEWELLKEEMLAKLAPLFEKVLGEVESGDENE